MLGEARLESRGLSEMVRGQPRRKLRLSTTASQGEGAASVEVLNISMVGLLLKTSGDLAVDEPLVVVLPNAGERAARVVWSADDVHGCRFIQPLSRADFSAALLKGAPFEGVTQPEAATTENPVSFGKRVRQLRIQSRHSMVELAAVVGVTKPTLWKWETDQVRPRQAALAKLAAALGVSERELLFGDGSYDGLAVAPSDDDTLTLAELIAECRARIGAKAGVDEDSVTIAIDWN